jgi:hypothetical protein
MMVNNDIGNITHRVDMLPVDSRKETSSHGNESTCNNRGTVQAVFSVVHAEAFATQRRSKHVSAATVEQK